jgi:HK97 family phage portal protein
MAENFLTRALKSFTTKSIEPNLPNALNGGFKFIDSYFSYLLGSGGSFVKYTKAYGNNPLVYMVVKKIAYTSASIERVIYREGEEDERYEEEEENSVILNLLSNPNPQDDEISFREKINEYLLLTGNAFVYIIRGEGGLGVELQVLLTQNVTIVVDTFGEVVGYDYMTYNGRVVRYDTDVILHIKTSNVVNIDTTSVHYGLSPLQSAWIVVNSSTEKLNADASIFKSRGIIGILTSDTDTPMLDPERKRLQEDFDKDAGGSDKYNKIKIASSRLRFLQTGMSPTDLRLLEGIMSSLRTICGVYGMPCVLFNDNESSTYNNIESAKKSAYTDVYIPLARKVDKELSRWLSDKLGIDEYIEVDLTSIEEIKASTNDVAMALNNVPANVAPRIMETFTIDEVRGLVGLSGLEDMTIGSELLGQATNQNNQNQTNAQQ